MSNKGIYIVLTAIVLGLIVFFTYNSVNCVHFFSTFCAVTPR